MPERVLFVDDEANILEAYRRTLRKSFDVKVAQGGLAALNLMAESEPFPVVVSDMQMPEMNGVQFLSDVKKRSPNTIRIMLTGNADQQTASEAINTADVFRFLNKPCPPDKMTEALNDALAIYKCQAAEQEVLENTVKGSISLMAELLSLTNPLVFGRTTTIRNYMMTCAEEMKLDNRWELEAAALTCQIGLATLSPSFFKKLAKGGRLSKQELETAKHLPNTAAQLINRIPRLESLAEVLRHQNRHFDSEGESYDGIAGKDTPIGSRILLVIRDLITNESKGYSSGEALAQMKLKTGKYDPEVIAAFGRIFDRQGAVALTQEIAIPQLKEGMVLANQLETFSGALLIRQGEEVNASTIFRLNNFLSNGEIGEKIMIYAPKN